MTLHGDDLTTEGVVTTKVAEHRLNDSNVGIGVTQIRRYVMHGILLEREGKPAYLPFSARKNQVSMTESGFRETLSMPCSISQRARSG